MEFIPCDRLFEGLNYACMTCADTESYLKHSVVGAELADSINELHDLYVNCSRPNWDEYGACEVSPEAVLEAASFLWQIPMDIALPTLIPEPDGGIGMEWSDKHGKTFVVSLSGTSAMTFAGLLGEGNKINGSARFVGSIPQNIRETLVQYFPRRRAGRTSKSAIGSITMTLTL